MGILGVLAAWVGYHLKVHGTHEPITTSLTTQIIAI